jgi:hypothetical protein
LSPQQQFVKALTDGDLQALKDLHAVEPRLVKQLITTNYGDDVDPLSHAISQGVRPLETGKLQHLEVQLLALLDTVSQRIESHL